MSQREGRIPASLPTAQQGLRIATQALWDVSQKQAATRPVADHVATLLSHAQQVLRGVDDLIACIQRGEA